MAILKYTINSVFGGVSPLRHGTVKGQYLDAIGIDPEFQVNGQASGYIVPVGYSSVTLAVSTGYPRWILGERDGSDNKVYIYNSAGELTSLTSGIASEVSEAAPTSGDGSGMAILNGYILLATPTNLSVYGQLSGGSPSITNSWWTATAGQSAMVSSTYPVIRNTATYPNHAIHVHGDGYAYMCDYNTISNVTRGLIHRIGITTAGANSGSLYNALDLPPNVRPFGCASYGTDLAIIGSAFSGEDPADLRIGNSYLFLWDTISDSFYKQIDVPSAIVTAVKNVSGALYIFGRNVGEGWQLYRYVGGDAVELLANFSTGTSPSMAAVDVQAGRLYFGGYKAIATLDDGALFGYGYEDARLGGSVLSVPAGLNNSGVSAVITAVRALEETTSGVYPLIGSSLASSLFNIKKYSSTATRSCVFHSESFVVGQKFKVRSVKLPLTAAVASGVNIIPTIVYDQSANTKTLSTIDNTNYSGKERITYGPLEIERASTAGVYGNNDFYLRLHFSSQTVETGIALPIEVEVETLDE